MMDASKLLGGWAFVLDWINSLYFHYVTVISFHIHLVIYIVRYIRILLLLCQKNNQSWISAERPLGGHLGRNFSLGGNLVLWKVFLSLILGIVWIVGVAPGIEPEARRGEVRIAENFDPVVYLAEGGEHLSGVEGWPCFHDENDLWNILVWPSPSRVLWRTACVFVIDFSFNLTISC